MIYLYIKRHTVTGLKYFGMTRSPNPFKYNGSGKYWLRHINKHGIEHIETIELYGFDSQDLCVEFALKFSQLNNIVESKEWANLRPENGSDGNVLGVPLSEEWKNNIRKAHTGVKKLPCSDERKRKISIANKGKPGCIHTDEFKARQSVRMKANNPAKTQTVKDKISATLTGRKLAPFSDEHRANMSQIASKPVEYKGKLYINLILFQEETGISKFLYKKYYLNGIDPEPYIGVYNIHAIRKITPIYI